MRYESLFVRTRLLGLSSAVSMRPVTCKKIVFHANVRTTADHVCCWASALPPLLPAPLLGNQPVLGVRLKHLHHVSHQVRQLLIQLDLLCVLPDPLVLPPALVLDPLDVAPEDAVLVIDELDPLPELGRGHGRRLVVLGPVGAGRVGVGPQ